jgi:hypothetical protein
MRKRLTKLQLHRETLRGLDAGRLRHAAGGGFTTPIPCLSEYTCGNPCTNFCTEPCSWTCHTPCGPQP